MTTRITQFISLFFLLAAMSGGLACSASAEKMQNDEITAALEDIPEGTINRFVLMVSTEKDEGAQKQNIASVLEALREGGAEKVEPLEGSSIIFVTCKVDAIYRALETGLLSSVQLDSLKKSQ